MAIHLPDNLGYIPLDYAGLFRHKEAMIFLIKTGLEKVKWELLQYFDDEKEKTENSCLFSGPEL